MIPRQIYQSWKTLELGPEMKKNVDLVRKQNPRYSHTLYDDEMCRSFILNNFGTTYANAFDSLRPGAFKCDMWRYAILYINGGVYMDIDMVPQVPLDEIIQSQDSLLTVKDRDMNGLTCMVYQAFIAVSPRHPVMKFALELCFSNISMKIDNLMDPLMVTGPTVMGVAMNLYWEHANTYQTIKAGRYPNGIRLLQNNDTSTAVVDENGRELIRNRFENYDRGLNNYATTETYHYNPRARIKKTIWASLIGFIAVFLILAWTLYIVKRRLSSCRVELSRSSISE